MQHVDPSRPQSIERPDIRIGIFEQNIPQSLRLVEKSELESKEEPAGSLASSKNESTASHFTGQ